MTINLRNGLEEIYRKHKALGRLQFVAWKRCCVGSTFDVLTNYLRCFICLNSLYISTKPFKAGT